MLRCILIVGTVLAITLIFISAPLHAADPKFPQLTGRVVDNAFLLDDPDKQQITAQLEALEVKTSDQLVVVTLPSLQGFEIEEFGYRLGRHWGIGQKNKDNGVLLIIAPNERKVRIEVGRRLEPLLTDAMTKIIIENRILPSFRSDDYPAGIKAGVSDIIAILTGDAEEVKMRAKSLAPGVNNINQNIFSIFIVLFWCFIIYSIIRHMTSAVRHNTPSSSYKKSSRSNKSSSNWDWGSGGSSGGGWSSGGGGGGFSGGGGSFGGGGSSGSW